MADYYALTTNSLPPALHGVDAEYSIRNLSDWERLAIRSLLKGKFSSADMLEYLKQMPPEALASGGTTVYAGRGGGRKLANDLIANLEQEGEVSLSTLQKLILSEG